MIPADLELKVMTWFAAGSPPRARAALLMILTSSALACGPASGGASGAAGSADTGGVGGSAGGGDGGSSGGAGGGSGDSGGSVEAGGAGGATGGSGGATGGSGGVTGGAGGGLAGTGSSSAGGGGVAGAGSGGAGGGGAGDGGAAGTSQSIPALKAAADPAGILIGAAVSNTHLSEVAYTATAAAQMNFLTPENEMKWDATEPMPNVFTFGPADAVVGFAAQNGMQVKGHTMVWHQQLPAWVSAIQDATELRNAMINHITQVGLHFRGKVISWDVVNEAMGDSGGQLRNDIFLQLLGARYIDDAFIAAHAADPYARLYYNDYGAEGTGAKSDAVYNLVQGMLARGVPIHGVGLQMHTGPTDVSPSAADLAGNMQRLAALGLDVMISELDVQICNSDTDTQGRRFHDIVAACKAQPFCRAVTVWGIPDKYSWRNGQTCATPKPLLFDDNYQAKPAHNGVLRALLGL
jgi:endo-1,4-beta-xylanase